MVSTSTLEGDLFNTISYKEVSTKEIVEAEMYLTGKKTYKAIGGKFGKYTNLITFYASLNSFNRSIEEMYSTHKKSPSTSLMTLSPELVNVYVGMVYGLIEELSKLRKSFNPEKINKEKLESLIESSKSFKVEEVVQTIVNIQKYISKSLPRMMFNRITFKNLAYRRIKEIITYLMKNPEDVDERIKNVKNNRIIQSILRTPKVS